MTPLKGPQFWSWHVPYSPYADHEGINSWIHIINNIQANILGTSKAHTVSIPTYKISLFHNWGWKYVNPIKSRYSLLPWWQYFLIFSGMKDTQKFVEQHEWQQKSLMYIQMSQCFLQNRCNLLILGQIPMLTDSTV
jgi:hypothetical protein